MQEAKMEQVILQGEYVVVDKKSSPGLKITTPAVQTCIALVLCSDNSVALAHVDTLQGLESLVKSVVKEMRAIDSQSIIYATLMGGDYNRIYDLRNKTICMRNKVISTLKTLKVDHTSVSHFSDFSKTNKIVVIAFVCLALFLFFNNPLSSSKNQNMSLAMLLVPLGLITFGGLALAGGKSMDVSVDIDSGKISIVQDNLPNSCQLVARSPQQSRKDLSERINFVRHRFPWSAEISPLLNFVKRDPQTTYNFSRPLASTVTSTRRKS